jgi:hypothetical protein
MTLNWLNLLTLGGNSVQQPVSNFDQEWSDHWEVLADMAYYQRMAMQEELDEDDMPMAWSEDQPKVSCYPFEWVNSGPSSCQQINTTQSEDCS